MKPKDSPGLTARLHFHTICTFQCKKKNSMYKKIHYVINTTIHKVAVLCSSVNFW